MPIMPHVKSSWTNWSIAGITMLIFAALSIPMLGQDAPSASPLSGGVVEDWSHHHLIFSNPGTEAEALAHGTYSRWWKIVNDPRYALQQAKRSSGAKTLDESSVHPVSLFAGVSEKANALRVGHLRPEPGRRFPGNPDRFNGLNGLSTDWDEGLISTGQFQPNMYPAKFSFSTTTASCTGDYVVTTTGVNGSGTTANIVAYNELYGTSGPSGTGCGSPASPTIAVPTLLWAYNTGAAAVTTSPVISNDSTGSKVAFIQYDSTTTTTSLVVVKWAATPATSSFTGNLNSTTSVTYTSGTAPTSADVGAQISASDGDIPANDTITAVSGSTVTLATAATGTASGVTLTIHAETSALPGVPVTTTNISGCTAPCMTVTTINSTAADAVTYSSPFYDYQPDDALYVGAGDGLLYKITGVFNGTSAPSVSSITLTGSTYEVASPVFDSVSGCVFVGDTEGYLYSVTSGNGGTVCNGGTFANYGHSEILGDGGAYEGIIDAPIVDSSTGFVYAFVTDSAHVGNCAVGDGCVVQFATNTITSGATTTAPANEEAIGSGAQYYDIQAGTFDNVYYASGGVAGNLWTIGNHNGTAGENLYRIPIGAGSAMSAALTAVSTLTNSGGHGGWTSPITEFCAPTSLATPCGEASGATTGGTDYIFFSTDYLTTAPGGCSTGGSGDDCMLGYNVTTPTSPTVVGGTNITTGGIGSPGCFSTGGIIVDNALTGSTSPAQVGGSEIYFAALAAGAAGSANSPGGPAVPTGAQIAGFTDCGNYADSGTPQLYQETQSAP
jgi:hypothetical protein